VDEKWCLGCHLCEYYCAFAQTNEKDMARALKDRKIAPRIQVEDSGNVHFAVSCRHCKEPLCVKACITGALSVEDSVIRIDPDRCVGCYTCVLICPYGAIAPAIAGATAPEGGGLVVQKCELCLQNKMGTPQCVQNCPNAAIVYEDRG
jgi:carbon-monoxide dehydrogenase iron sulfur subunit